MLRACAVAEQEGIPAVAVCATSFLRQGRAIAQAVGIPHVPIAEYPGMPPVDSAEEQAQKIREHVVPSIIDGLIGRAGQDVGSDVARNGSAKEEPDARQIIFSGSLGDVQEHFDERLWTDGMPVIPPTLDAVDAFLAHTPHEPELSLGILAPEYRQATVWSVAVNGVMAGCRPEYMPLLVAIVEAICDPAFRQDSAGATPGWEPMVVVSGPAVKRFGFNHGSGLMRVGPRANTSIGRFLRLYERNVAGLRTPPGTTDKGLIGQTFHVAMAEDDESTRAIGWDPYRVDRGFDLGDDVVTVRSVYAVSLPLYTAGTPEEHLQWLAVVLGQIAGPWLFTGFYTDATHPMLLLSPMVAEILANGGVSKDDIRAYLYENARISSRWADYNAIAGGAGRYWTLEEMIPQGRVPARYGDQFDPERMVQVVLRQETIDIVVAGDPGRNQSKFYINNQGLGAPVSRKVVYANA